MTPEARTTSRRIFLGGVLLAGACAANSANAFGHGTGADARHAARHGMRSTGSYRLKPQAGTPATAHRASTSVTYTLGSEADRRIALTFDDGPDPVYTPQILDVLRRHGVPATFCVLGENAVGNRGLLQAIADGGHLIANHSWSHPALPRMRPADARRELGRTSDLIEEVVGSPPAWARAPFGYWDEKTLRISAGLGMSPLGWSIDTEDWRQPGVSHIVSTVLGNVRSGSIVLTHDGGADAAQTVAALHEYLPRLLDSGWIPSLPPVPEYGAYEGTTASEDTTPGRMRPAVR